MAVSFSTPSAAAAESDTLDTVTTRGSTTTNSIQVGGVNVAGNYALPTADGTNGQFLQTDGSGSVSFATVSITGNLTYKGSYNAATSTPSLVTALKGDFYIISVAGSLAGVNLAVGDHIVFNQNAANPVTSAMFDVIDNSEADTLDTVTTRGSTTANSVQVGGLNVAGNYNLPTVDGSAGQAITTNGSGTLSFNTVLTDVVQDTTPQLGGSLDVNGQSITSASNGDVTINPDGTGEIKLGADLIPDADATHTIGSESERFISAYTDLNGAIRFKAKNDSGGVINKGQVVYIKGISGTVPTVGLARANSAATMPAFGLALANANDQAEVQIITFGNLTDVNTTTYSLSLNDTVFVSAATAGALTNSAPAGEANFIQNIGRVIRADASAGIIKVGGAGRSNATPNLDNGKIFRGNASNQAESVALSSIALSSLNDDLSYLTPANNLSDVANAGTARTNLGVAIGSDVQAYDAQLADVAGLTPADGSFIVGDGANFVSESGATARASLGLTIGTDVLSATAGLNDLSDVSFSAGPGIDNYVLTYDNTSSSWGAEAVSGGGDLLAANNLSDLANAATARTNLGVAIGSDVQAYDAGLADIASIPTTDGVFIVGNGTNFVAEIGSTARTSLGLGTAAVQDSGDFLQPSNNLSDVANAGTARTNLGVAIGSDVQAYDAQLADVAGLTPADGSFIVGNGTNFVAESGATARTSLGLGTAATSATTDFLASTAGLNNLSDVSFTAGPGIDNYVLTYDNGTSSWGAEAASGGGIAAVVDDTSPQLGGNLDTNGQDIVTTSNADLDLAPDGTGVVVVRGNQTGGNNQGAIKLNCEHNSHGVTIKSPAHASLASYTLTLPTTDGQANEVLQTDGSGVLSWVGITGSVPQVTSASPTGNYTISTSGGIEELYLLNPSVDISVFLPSAASCGNGYKYTIKNLSANTITIDPNGSEYIDFSGNTTFDIPAQYDAVTIVTDGSNWFLV